MEVKNAKITRTMLGVEDHGILTIMLTLDYGGSGQGFGGYTLDAPPAQRGGERLATADCGEWVADILRVLRVGEWEKVAGQHCRAAIIGGLAKGIGHLLEDRWMRPTDDGVLVGTFAELFPEADR